MLDGINYITIRQNSPGAIWGVRIGSFDLEITDAEALIQGHIMLLLLDDEEE